MDVDMGGVHERGEMRNMIEKRIRCRNCSYQTWKYKCSAPESGKDGMKCSKARLSGRCGPSAVWFKPRIVRQP